MAHEHHHSHGHGIDINRSFKIAVILNIGIVVFEATYGFIGHSVALIADAGHNFTDVFGLLLAWGANVAATRPPTKKRTYGYRRTTILASLINSVVLLITTGAVLWEAIYRLMYPTTVEGILISKIAAIAIVLNVFSALLFRKEKKKDINVRAAYLHMASDAAVSFGVVIAGFLIAWTGAFWIDPLVSIIISIVIAIGTWQILRDSFNLAVDAVPGHIDQDAIEKYLGELQGVTEVHDLHIWGMSTTHSILTVHLVIPREEVKDNFLFSVCNELHEKFGIEHSTIQIEHGDTACDLAPSHVI